MCWRDVDTVARRLTVARSYKGAPKSGKARHLPLAAALVPILEALRPLCPLIEEGLICPMSRAGVWRMPMMAFRETNALYAAAELRVSAAPWLPAPPLRVALPDARRQPGRALAAARPRRRARRSAST